MSGANQGHGAPARPERSEGVIVGGERAEVIARVAALATGRTAWVGIDGPGGAGKSTLAAAVRDAVAGVVVIAVDDFSGPREPQWDWDRFRAQVLLPLGAGRPARYQRWDWERDAGAEWHDVPVGSVLVVEGVSATRDEVGAEWDLRIWVETPRDLRLARALERDGPAMMPRWHDDWIPSEERYFAAQSPRERADLIVYGTAK